MEFTSAAGIVGLCIGGVMALYLLVATVAAPFFSRKPKVEKKPAEGENIGEGKVSSRRFPTGATVPGRRFKKNAASASQVNMKMEEMKEIEAAPHVVIENGLYDQAAQPEGTLEKMQHAEFDKLDAHLEEKVVYDKASKP